MSRQIWDDHAPRPRRPQDGAAQPETGAADPAEPARHADDGSGPGTEPEPVR